MNANLKYLVVAGALLFAGSAFAGPNDPHSYPIVASKNTPTHVDHIVNANNRAPVYPVTTKPELHNTHHHVPHHGG